MTTRFATLGNGVDIAYDVIGDLSCPVVMPILGITDNLTDWPENLCEPLVQAGYCVVRHETRDMGWSTQMEGAHYDMENIADDVVGLMNHLSIGSADLVGYSLGGAVAQLLALTAPNRVRRLVALQSTSYNPSLPPRSPAVLGAMKNACTEYETEAEAVAALKAVRLACNGSLHAMSDEEARKSAEGSVARGYQPHGTARMIEARQRTAPFHERLAQITSPMLVLQGTDDPIFPIGHGEDIARRVPGAELVYLQGAGHNHPQSLVPQLVTRIRDFLLSTPSGAP
jgi:pimeloyl-ACP methyl ester carboxylesterase